MGLIPDLEVNLAVRDEPKKRQAEMTDSYNQQDINLVPPPTGALNSSGGALAIGTIVAQDPATDDAVVPTTLANQEDVLGVVRVGGADGERISLATVGPFEVLMTGVVIRGDFISASAIAGVGIVAAAVPGVFAIAIESNAAVGTRLVRCRWVRAELF